MTYNCLIVDDERPALKLLTAYISKLPQLNLVASCENAITTISALQQHQVDILFLDIQMPDLTGIELLKVLKIKPQVVLTTAYRDYAVEGFALNVTDYLLKPFSFERFAAAVNKATDQLELSQQSVTVSANQAPSVVDDHFFVRTNYKMEKIEFSMIKYVESMREYVSIFTTTQRYVINYTMNKMESALPASRFMRVHRSYIVGLDKIQGVEGNMILIDDNKIPIGASYRKRFFDQLKTL